MTAPGTPEECAERPCAAAAVGRYPLYPVHLLAPPVTGVPGRGEAFEAFCSPAGASAPKHARSSIRCRKSGCGMGRTATRPRSAPRFRSGRLLAIFATNSKAQSATELSTRLPAHSTAGGSVSLCQRTGVLAQLIDHYAGPDSADGAGAAPSTPGASPPPYSASFASARLFSGRTYTERKTCRPISAPRWLMSSAVFSKRWNRTAIFWQKVRGSEAIPAFGPPFSVTANPVTVNAGRMVESYRLGYQDLQGIWSLVLPPAALLEYKKLSRAPESQFRFPDDLWARTVYDFGLAWHLRVMDRDHLLRAITPVYLGWAGFFGAGVANRWRRGGGSQAGASLHGL